jgi:hypothetical protein
MRLGVSLVSGTLHSRVWSANDAPARQSYAAPRGSVHQKSGCLSACLSCRSGMQRINAPHLEGDKKPPTLWNHIGQWLKTSTRSEYCSPLSMSKGIEGSGMDTAYVERVYSGIQLVDPYSLDCVSPDLAVCDHLFGVPEIIVPRTQESPGWRRHG